MTKAFTIKVKVIHLTGVCDDLNYVVIANNSKHAVRVLIDNHLFPIVKVSKITIGDYHGAMVIPED